MANLVFQAVRLSRRFPAFPWQPWAVSLLWSGIASVGMLIVLWWYVGQVDWLAPAGFRLSRLGSLGGALLIGVCSFGVLVWPGGKDELRALLGILPHRLLGLLPQFLQPRQ
jgi:peptidoglycan biosynthesis protein MviN/MurJ (putative lipid II flippase)